MLRCYGELLTPPPPSSPPRPPPSPSSSSSLLSFSVVNFPFLLLLLPLLPLLYFNWFLFMGSFIVFFSPGLVLFLKTFLSVILLLLFFCFFGLFCSDAVVARVILIEFWSYWTIAVFVTKSAERHQPGTEWSRHATPRISFWNYHLNDLADHVFEYRGLLLEIYLHRKESHL